MTTKPAAVTRLLPDAAFAEILTSLEFEEELPDKTRERDLERVRASIEEAIAVFRLAVTIRQEPGKRDTVAPLRTVAAMTRNLHGLLAGFHPGVIDQLLRGVAPKVTALEMRRAEVQLGQAVASIAWLAYQAEQATAAAEQYLPPDPGRGKAAAKPEHDGFYRRLFTIYHTFRERHPSTGPRRGITQRERPSAKPMGEGYEVVGPLPSFIRSCAAVAGLSPGDHVIWWHYRKWRTGGKGAETV